jgi:uncharacterized repeat protein (TIGR01451 family)
VYAQAGTIGGTNITNTVTLNYDDAGGTGQATETDSVAVLVNNVPVVLWDTAPTDQTTGSGDFLQDGAGLNTPYNLTLTNAGNVSEIYALSDNTTESCSGTGSLTATNFQFRDAANAPLTSIALGVGTLTAEAANGDTVITVQPDATNDSVSNGLSVGSRVIIDTVNYPSGTFNTAVITAIDETDPLATLITIDTALSLVSNIPVGTAIGEQADISFGLNDGGSNLDVVGTITADTSCTHAHSINADGDSTANGGNSDSTADVTFTTTVEATALTVQKLVRNDTDATKNTGTVVTTDWGNFYADGVSANPGEVLGYLLVVDNASGGDATNVVVADTLPLFTTLVTGQVSLDTNGNGTFDVLLSGESIAQDDGVIWLDGRDLTVYAGVGGSDNSTTPSGGEVAGGSKSAVLFQVTVD